jgi:hypothetical protein
MFLSNWPIGGRGLEVHLETRVTQTNRTTAMDRRNTNTRTKSVGWPEEGKISEE